MESKNAGFRPESVDTSKPQCHRQGSLHISRRTSWGTPIPAPSSQTEPINVSSQEMVDVELVTSVDSDSDSESQASQDLQRRTTWDTIAALGLSFARDHEQLESNSLQPRLFPDDDSPPTGEMNVDRPFNKWMKTIQRRATARRQTIGGEYSQIHEDVDVDSRAGRRFSHAKSSSGSSFGFVTTIKTASISLASFSVAQRSKRTGVSSSRQQRADLSSKASVRGRLSEDSSYLSRGLVIDQGVTNRLLQRRKILEELITTEEGYIADVRFLMTVYVTFLASIPSLSISLRTSINRNLNEIIELHEEILGELHLAVPNSEYTQLKLSQPLPLNPTSHKGHTRWRSLDAVPESVGGSAWLQKIPGMTAEPQIAAAVANIFSNKLNRLFVYEEYGAKYDFMIKDIATAYRTIPQWETYERGIEALASSLASTNSQEGNSKKALTVGDLLVKPIQRVCKYPLLFAELLKHTPVYDCPNSHMEIENLLIRLREATTAINRATDDPRMKITMEKTWLLQDRLTFVDMPGVRSQNSIRALGHIHLCGVLYVSWQTKLSVDGQYLVCLLYRDFLLFATTPKNEQVYVVQACISLVELHIEEVDNGRGLQCHTAPFSWKLVFECDHYLYEITMTACSPKEELEWRSRIADRSFKGSLGSGERGMFTSLSLPIKAMGPVFGKPGTVARSISIHRATTVSPNTGRCQVIIKNTNAFKESPSSAAINRSQSLLTTNRIPILAPARTERMRIETLLSDVWTREVLPYPGMAGRSRSEQIVRNSAHSMMRKLSVASITSNFTKRSGSMASIQRTPEDGNSGDQTVDTPLQGSSSRSDTHSSGDTCKPTEAERLSIIQDEREVGIVGTSSDGLRSVTNSSSATIQRAAILQPGKSCSTDGQQTITPPLRISSRNQHKSTKSIPAEVGVTLDGTVADKENKDTKQQQSSCVNQTSSPSTNQPSHGKDSKEKEKSGRRIKGRQLVSGALSFFR